MFIKNSAIWIICLLFGVSLLSGCAKRKSNSESRGSSSTPAIDDSLYRLAECNRISNSSMGLTGGLSSYYNLGKSVPDQILMNLDSMPTEIAATSSKYLQIFRWSERTPGQKTYNTSPVQFYFVNKLTGIQVGSTLFDKISKSVIDTLISTNNLSTSGTNKDNFFTRHYLLLTKMDTNWDAITIAYYNSATGPNTYISTNALLPSFYSNPNIYAKARPAQNLYILHPNYSQKDSNLSEDQYFQLTESICDNFFVSAGPDLRPAPNRMPASSDATGEFETAPWWLSLVNKIKSWF